jgi:hypothetical protein
LTPGAVIVFNHDTLRPVVWHIPYGNGEVDITTGAVVGVEDCVLYVCEVFYLDTRFALVVWNGQIRYIHECWFDSETFMRITL